MYFRTYLFRAAETSLADRSISGNLKISEISDALSLSLARQKYRFIEETRDSNAHAIS